MVTGKYGGLIWSRMMRSTEGNGAGKDEAVPLHPGGTEERDALEMVPVEMGEEDGRTRARDRACFSRETPRSRSPVPPSRMMTSAVIRAHLQAGGVAADGAEEVRAEARRETARAIAALSRSAGRMRWTTEAILLRTWSGRKRSRKGTANAPELHLHVAHLPSALEEAFVDARGRASLRSPPGSGRPPCPSRGSSSRASPSLSREATHALQNGKLRHCRGRASYTRASAVLPQDAVEVRLSP